MRYDKSKVNLKKKFNFTGIKPLSGEFSAAAAHRFMELCQDKTFQALVKGKEKVDVPGIGESDVVILDLIDAMTKSDEKLFIGRLLIEEGHAVSSID